MSNNQFSDINQFYSKAVASKDKELRAISKEESVHKKQAKRLIQTKKKEAQNVKRRVNDSVHSLFGNSSPNIFSSLRR